MPDGLNAAAPRTVALPMQMRQASVAPGSFDANERTVDLVWSTGAAVRRADFWTGEIYDEVLSVDTRHCDLSVLNAGAPLLDSHYRYTLSGQIGVVVRASIEGGKGRATVRFSERAEVASIVKDVEAGIIRNVSVGYFTRRYEVDRSKAVPVYRAIDWQPFEISLVPVPADPGAQIRGGQAAPQQPCELVLASTGETKMDKEAEAGTRSADPAASAAATTEQQTTTVQAAATETRAGPAGGSQTPGTGPVAQAAAPLVELRRIGGLLKLSPEAVMDVAERGLPLEAARAALIDAAAAASPGAGAVRTTVEVIGSHDDPEKIRAAMGLALAAQGNLAVKPEGRAAQFMHFSPVEMYAELQRARGVNIDHRNRVKVVDLIFTRDGGAHSTSDFPLLLQDAANKMMLPGYQAAPVTYRAWAAQRPFKDFKAHKFLRLGDFPALAAVKEDEEINYGTISENREQVTAGEYNSGVAVTRRMLINDDLGAFTDFAAMAGSRAANDENALVYALIASDGPTLSDSVALYSTAATRLNKASSGTVINVANVAAGRAVVRKQTSIDGLKLNLDANILLAGPDKELEAMQMVTSITPALITSVNPYSSKLTVVIDANISGNRWHLFVPPGTQPCVVWGYVGGQQGPQMTTTIDFETQALKVRLGLDFAAGVVDWRETYLNTGA